MDPTSLMLSMLAGLAGMGMMMYAKSAQRLTPMVSGLGLMLLPYFISNLIVLAMVCGGLICLPFVFRDT